MRAKKFIKFANINQNLVDKIKKYLKKNIKGKQLLKLK